MEPVTEVASFFLKSGDVSQPLLQVLNNTLFNNQDSYASTGASSTRMQRRSVVSLTRDDISQHEQFMAGPSYSPFLDKLDPFVQSPLQFHHVKFNPIPASVLGYGGGKCKTPVVEVLYMYFPGDDSFTP